MFEHERGGPDPGDGIGRAGPGDVMGGAVHGLEQRRARAGRVEVGRGGEPDPPRHRAGEVREDVAEEVVGDDHVVALGSLHQVDAGCVDVVVVARHAGVLARHLVDHPLPQVTGEREDVGLVDERQVTAGPSTASSKANRTHRSTPMRVFTDPCVATSNGVARRRKPPSPQ